MKHNVYNVITPLTRMHLYNDLKQMIESQFSFDHTIKWHILLDSDNPTNIDKEEKDHWIRFYRIEMEKTEQDKGHVILNKFFEIGNIQDSERYNILCDDDAYSRNFFTNLDFIDYEVIICSMERGHNIPSGLDPKRAHPTNKLWACKENLVLGGVGMEQIILSGRILKKYRIPTQHFGDGIFIINIARENRVKFAPEIVALFNYFEPGRWNK